MAVKAKKRGRKKKVTKEFMEKYLSLVQTIAATVAGKGLPPNVEFNDLVSDGVVGLMKAYETFNPERGVKFETYASYRIRGEILDGLRMYNPVPYRVQVKIRDVAKHGYKALVRKKEEFEAGEEMDLDELPKDKMLSEEEFQTAVSKIQKIVAASALMYLLSLETVTESTGEDVEEESSPAEDMEFSELKGRLESALEGLPLLEKKVIRLFYRKDMTQREISKKLNLSPSKVNRVLGKAIMRLRRNLDDGTIPKEVR
ncbi:MAG: sigma-70 family RNA polymerase sigma factor [bacterium]